MINHTPNIKKNILKFLVLTGVVASFTAQSASLSTYRIYLDKGKPTESFIVFSKSVTDESCNLTLVHNDFDATGNMTRHSDDSLPNNSAKPWFRYTPRHFTLKASSSQSIRFSMRRKANSQPAEYRSYIAVNCQPVKNNRATPSSTGDTAALGVVPMLVQNVPVIVRSGKLNAELTFDNVKISKNKLAVTLNRTGNRSIYGKLSLIDKSSGDVINFTDGISIYTETSSMTLDFPLLSSSSNEFQLRFEENELYGGSIIIEKDIIL